MEVHIGKEIEEKYNESGLKLSEFAKRIDTGERNIYSIFKRKSVDSELLKKVGEALDFDFFSLYQDSYTKKSLKTAMVEEPGFPGFEYLRRVSITIELDGQKETLNEWITTLKKINAALA